MSQRDAYLADFLEQCREARVTRESEKDSGSEELTDLLWTVTYGARWCEHCKRAFPTSDQHWHGNHIMVTG